MGPGNGPRAGGAVEASLANEPRQRDNEWNPKNIRTPERMTSVLAVYSLD